MRAFEVNTSRDRTYHVRIGVPLYFRTYVAKEGANMYYYQANYFFESEWILNLTTWGFTSYTIDNCNQHSVIEFSFKTYVMYSGLSIYKSYDIDVCREFK